MKAIANTSKRNERVGLGNACNTHTHTLPLSLSLSLSLSHTHTRKLTMKNIEDPSIAMLHLKNISIFLSFEYV